MRSENIIKYIPAINSRWIINVFDSLILILPIFIAIALNTHSPITITFDIGEKMNIIAIVTISIIIGNKIREIIYIHKTRGLKTYWLDLLKGLFIVYESVVGVLLASALLEISFNQIAYQLLLIITAINGLLQAETLKNRFLKT